MIFWNSSFKVIGRFLGKFVSHGLEALGVLWLLTNFGVLFFPSLSSGVKEFLWLYLIVTLFYGVWRARPRLRVHSGISNTDVSIVIRVGDLFKQDESVVVAAPTTFDIAMDDETIDEKI